MAFDVRATAPLEVVSAPALQELDDTLFARTHSRFAALEKVAFRVPAAAARGELHAQLKAGLPGAEKRGALVLDVVHEST